MDQERLREGTTYFRTDERGRTKQVACKRSENNSLDRGIAKKIKRGNESMDATEALGQARTKPTARRTVIRSTPGTRIDDIENDSSNFKTDETTSEEEKKLEDEMFDRVMGMELQNFFWAIRHKYGVSVGEPGPGWREPELPDFVPAELMEFIHTKVFNSESNGYWTGDEPVTVKLDKILRELFYHMFEPAYFRELSSLLSEVSLQSWLVFAGKYITSDVIFDRVQMAAFQKQHGVDLESMDKYEESTCDVLQAIQPAVLWSLVLQMREEIWKDASARDVEESRDEMIYDKTTGELFLANLFRDWYAICYMQTEGKEDKFMSWEYCKFCMNLKKNQSADWTAQRYADHYFDPKSKSKKTLIVLPCKWSHPGHNGKILPEAMFRRKFYEKAMRMTVMSEENAADAFNPWESTVGEFFKLFKDAVQHYEREVISPNEGNVYDFR